MPVIIPITSERQNMQIRIDKKMEESLPPPKTKN
jgi:hypothetical protein